MMTPTEKLGAAGSRLAKAQEQVSKADWPADVLPLVTERSQKWVALNGLSSDLFERLQRDLKGGFQGDDWETLIQADRLNTEAEYWEHLLEMLP